MTLELSQQIFEKFSNIRFYDNKPSSGSRVVACGRTEGQADMTKPIAFRNFANASKKMAAIAKLYMRTQARPDLGAEIFRGTNETSS
jgi:hypothetical protein